MVIYVSEEWRTVRVARMFDDWVYYLWNSDGVCIEMNHSDDGSRAIHHWLPNTGIYGVGSMDGTWMLIGGIYG
jgi:hypothetical protein